MSETGRPNCLPSSCKDAGKRYSLPSSGECSSLQRLKAVRIGRHTPMTLLNHGASPGGMPCAMHHRQPDPAGPVDPCTKQGISLADDTMMRVYHKVLKIANEWDTIGSYVVTKMPPIERAPTCRLPNINDNVNYVKFVFRTRRNTSGTSVMIPSAPSITKRRISSGSLTVQTLTRYPARRTSGRM